jgi:hypothetical protein
VLDSNNQSLRYLKGYQAVYAYQDELNFIKEAIRRSARAMLTYQTLRKNLRESLKLFA